MKIYLISLARAIERRECMVNQLSRLGLDFQIIEAFDGEEPFVDQVADVDPEPIFRKKKNRDPYRGEIGCYYSHLAAMEMILSFEKGWGVIMEDDIEIFPNFNGTIEAQLNSPEVEGWDMFYLCQPIFDWDTKRSDQKGEFWQKLNSGRVGTQCYAISHRFARWFLDNRMKMTRALDWEFWMCGTDKNFNFYDLIPPHRPCGLMNSPSYISKGIR